jgi:hypothetical protein
MRALHLASLLVATATCAQVIGVGDVQIEETAASVAVRAATSHSRLRRRQRARNRAAGAPAVAVREQKIAPTTRMTTAMV